MMGFDITIGKTSIDYKAAVERMNTEDGIYILQCHLRVAPCEGIEPDGLTSLEFTITKGPTRAPSYVGWAEFMNCCQPLIELKEKIHPTSSDGDIYALNTNFIKTTLINLYDIIPSLPPIHRDRANWLYYWMNKAIELYGDCAGIQFH